MVTALTRPDSESKLTSGIEAVKVDYGDEEALTVALRGQQALIITMSVLAPADTHDRLVAAAARAGVPDVMPNCWGLDFTDPSLAGEMLMPKTLANIAAVRERGVSAWIGLVCGSWYEYSLSLAPDAYGIDVRGRRITFFDDGNTRISASTWPQCGRAVAALLSLKELPDDEADHSVTLSTYANRPVFVASFLITQRDMLDSLHRVLGTTDADWAITHQPTKERYDVAMEEVKAGNPRASGRASYARLFFPSGGGDYESTRGLDNEALGLAKEDLDVGTKLGVDMLESGWVPDFLAAMQKRMMQKPKQ